MMYQKWKVILSNQNKTNNVMITINRNNIKNGVYLNNLICNIINIKYFLKEQK